MNIKDSGDRTVFPTGAVRDMHKGKGRYDLREPFFNCFHEGPKKGKRKWKKDPDRVDSALV